jgi:hypothetical protein
MTRRLAAVAIPCLLLLAACGNEPKEAEMRAALETRVAAEQQQMHEMRQMMSGAAAGLGSGRPVAAT